MVLPQIFNSKKAQPELFITILISDTKIQSALWQQFQDEIKIIIVSAIYSYDDVEQALSQTDLSLQQLGKMSENVNRVIFGLEPGWVSEKGVVDAKKPLLKKITEDLELQAEGFVVTTESLTQYLVVDNPRLSALLLQFTKQTISISLINQGQLLQQTQVGRSGDTLADMKEALARLSSHMGTDLKLPNKILAASFDLERDELLEQQQLLLEYDWMKEYPFIQPPTIDLIDKSDIMLAVLNQKNSAEGTPAQFAAGIAASQGEAAAVPAESAAATPTPIPVAETSAQPVAVNPDDNVVETDFPTNSVPNSAQPELAIDESQLPRAAAQINSGAQKTSASSFGIPLQMNQPPQVDGNEDDESDELVTGFKGQFLQLLTKHKPFVIGGFLAGVIALFIASYFWLAQATQAVVKLELNSSYLAKEVDITIASDIAKSNPEELLLAAEVFTHEVSGSKTSETSGIKLVGDQAKGKVKLFNKTEAEKSFEAGTELKKGDLVFTLDETVQVASASVKKSTSSESKEYGSAEASVTAVEIGTDSNLGKDTELQIESFDEDTYSATVIDGLSGGSSREVRVVSEEDRQQLLQELRQELITQANEEMNKLVGEGNSLAPTNNAEVMEAVYDAEIGKEVGSLTLNLTMSVKGLRYQNDDIMPIAVVVLTDSLPPGYTLANSEPSFTTDTKESASSSASVKLAANFTAQAQPELNLDELRQNLAGKTKEEAVKMLAENEFVKDAQISFSPPFAAKLTSRLPKDPAKIKIE